MPTAADIKRTLMFFEALGFERLPIRMPSPCAARAGAGNPRTADSAGAMDKAEALEGLRAEIGPCTRCKLSENRANVVFGEGDPSARIMFIGEGPGAEEDRQGRPFVGDAGKLLDRLIERMGLKRSDTYIANIVKCRPRGNRDPEPDEISTCLPFLKRQIAIIRPEAIISLGRISAHTLTGTNTPITRLRGKMSRCEGIALMPTFHPAYLLRNPKDKILVWNDAQAVLRLLGMDEG